MREMDKEVLIHVSGLQTMDAEGDQGADRDRCAGASVV